MLKEAWKKPYSAKKMRFNQAFQAQFFGLLQKSSSLTERECFALWALLTTIVDTRAFSFSEVSRRFGRRIGRNFLARTLKKYAYLQTQLMEQVIKTALAELTPRTPLYLIGDDTLVGKTGQQMFGTLAWYDHTQRRRVRAICLVTVAVVMHETVVAVLPWILVNPPNKQQSSTSTRKEQDRKTQAVMELMNTVIDWVQAEGVKASQITVLADSWFSSRPMMNWVRQKQVNFRIDGKKSYRVQLPDHQARKQARQRRRGRKRKYFVTYRRIEAYLEPPKTWSYTTDPTTGQRLYWKKAVVTLKSAGRVTVYAYWREDRLHPTFILANARYQRPCDARTVYRDYKHRWLIEQAHKDLKQHLGLSRCQARDPWTVVGFFGTVTFAYAALKLTVLQTEHTDQKPWTCPTWANQFHKEHIQALTTSTS